MRFLNNSLDSVHCTRIQTSKLLFKSSSSSKVTDSLHFNCGRWFNGAFSVSFFLTWGTWVILAVIFHLFVSKALTGRNVVLNLMKVSMRWFHWWGYFFQVWSDLWFAVGAVGQQFLVIVEPLAADEAGGDDLSVRWPHLLCRRLQFAAVPVDHVGPGHAEVLCA